MSLEIQVFSDVICPWCYIGKRRLERALAKIRDRTETVVHWRPFQLNPAMPQGGMSRREYRTAKFGNWERSLELDARVATIGASEGLAFDFRRIERTPNTSAAHRLIWLAGRECEQNVVVEGLFRAYFCEGEDTGDTQVLARIAESSPI